MRLPRGRMTLQQLMLAMGTVTILIIGPRELAILLERRQFFSQRAVSERRTADAALQKAGEYGRAAAFNRQRQDAGEPMADGMILGPNHSWADYTEHFLFLEQRARAAEAHHAALADKYAYAAGHPWLLVDPDPVPPAPWSEVQIDSPVTRRH